MIEMSKYGNWDYGKYPGAKKHPHLFKPVKIGKLEIPNRIKYAATEDNLNGHDGFVTDAGAAYIKDRATGVVGGICTIQGVYMDKNREGQGYVGQAAAWDDKFIPGLKRMADLIHGEGAIANYQLMHCGRVGGADIDHCAGPSGIPQRLNVFRPVREMSHADVKQCVKEHMDAARRGVEAGFDIIEISGIVGYLISNFLSSYTNRRTDEYGGDIEGRCRFMCEIIEGVRDEIGKIDKNIPTIIRICAEELLDDVGGNTPEESMVTYRMAEKSGIDCISVTQGWQESSIPVISRDIPQGTWLYNAKRAKQAVKIPVSMAYRLFDPSIPNKAIGEGILDIWENCRPQIADPFLPKKVLEGREEDIRWCVACNLCLARLFRDAPMTCYVNPVCAHEWDPNWQIKPAETTKKVMVVGAGPAGLEAAWVAAQRGHEVHVYDKNPHLGGQLLIAKNAPDGDEELYGMVKFQEAQCKKNGVTFHLGTAVTPKTIEDEMPDAVVLATGAKFVRDKIPGYDRPNVVCAEDVLSGKVEPGKSVVIWGGKKPGIAVALYLGEKGGRKLTLVSKERKVGKDVNPSYIWRYVQKMGQKKVTSYKDSSIEAINEGHVIIKAPHETRIPVRADTVVYAEREPVTDLQDSIKAANIELHLIGDALVPRTMSNALHDGYRTGLRV